MKPFLFLFVFAISCGVVLSQQKMRTDSTKTRPHGGRVIASDSLINEHFRQANITEEKLSKLKEIGLDLRGHLSQSYDADERVDAAMSDLVFIGKVLSIQDMPCAESEPFHSKVNVQIIDLLKGPRQQNDTIQLLIQSGPITTKVNKKGHYLIRDVTTDACFKIGKTYSLFAERTYNDPYLTTVYKDYFLKRKSAKMSPEYWVRGTDNYEIINSFVNYNGYYIPIDSFKVEIKKIADIVDMP